MDEKRKCAGGHNRRYDKCVDCRGSLIVARMLHQHAKHRAKKKGIPFNITLEETEQLVRQTRGFCPVLGIQLVVHKGRAADGSPSLDKQIDAKGYVSGNCAVISLLANRIKSTGTATQILKVSKYVEKIEAT